MTIILSDTDVSVCVAACAGVDTVLNMENIARIKALYGLK